MLENAVLYARIILLALPFNVLQLLFQSFCVTAEKPRLGLTVTVMSGVTVRPRRGFSAVTQKDWKRSCNTLNGRARSMMRA